MGRGAWADIYIFQGLGLSYGWGDRVVCVLRRGGFAPFDAFTSRFAYSHLAVRSLLSIELSPAPATRASVPRLGFGCGCVRVMRVLFLFDI